MSSPAYQRILLKLSGEALKGELQLGIEPRVALVSFSNFGSVKHEQVEKVQRALELVRKARPQLIV
ncbi:MAG: phosphate acyltransferase, partial [Panacagrimonas sp.]